MQYNNLEKFLAKIEKGGQPLTGCVVTFSDPAVSEMAAEAGFDFCWIDGEHGVLDRNTAMNHIMAFKGTDCAPFYRVPCCSHPEIKRIIDFAPAGIIVPMIMNAEDARYAVSACRYPIAGGGRGCGYRRGNAYGSIPNGDYLALAAHEPLVILQIEHIEAYRNLDAILAVPGVDSIMIGPYDFTMSMGKPGAFDDQEVNGIFDDICRKARQANVLLGAYAEGNYDRWRKRGVQYIGCINDTTAMMMGFREMRRRIAMAWN